MRRWLLLVSTLVAPAGAMLVPSVAAADGNAPPGAPAAKAGDPAAAAAAATTATAGGDEDPPPPKPRAEPAAEAPENPLAVPDAVKARIGSDAEDRPFGAQGDVTRKYFPVYEETRGDYRLKLLPPFYLDHTRGLGTAQEDHEGLYGLFYYRRRSPKTDADIVFPLAWRVRDRENHVLVLGPVAHREAPGEHDNWVAPLVFEGARKNGGYFHMPLLLTSSHWNPAGAFTLVGPYFRDRTGSDVDWGVAPFFFHGDNGSTDGARKTYTLIPPLLYYHRERELEGTSFTLVGPVISESTPKRNIFDVAPLFFHIEGKPESGGKRESHTTLFPLFHYGRSEAQSLFVLPGYLRRVTKTADTMITPLFSMASTRRGATRFIAAGPVAPLFMDYADKDTGLHWTSVFPFFFNSDSPKGYTLATPLFAHSRSYGQSRTTWVFPTLVVSRDTKGYETDLHPLLYFGRSEQSSHSVVAPIYWDFKSATSRATIAFPLLWRFASYDTGSVTQVAGNTLYMERRVRGGTDWSFHVLPLFSYGREPEGYFWNVLFGLAGYTRRGADAYVRALWIPFQVDGAQTASPQQASGLAPQGR